jgi:hypothetical protein
MVPWSAIFSTPAGNFAFITEVTERFSGVLTFEVVQEPTHVFGGDFISIVRSRDGWWADIRDVDGIADSLCGIAGVGPEGAGTGADGFKAAIWSIGD